MKSPPPKLARTPSSGFKAPPKLERLPSGVKSPPPVSTPKLERMPSGVKSPPTSVPTPSLIRQVSGATGSGVRSPPPKLGPRRSSAQASQPPPPTPAAVGEKLNLAGWMSSAQAATDKAKESAAAG